MVISLYCCIKIADRLLLVFMSAAHIQHLYGDPIYGDCSGGFVYGGLSE